MTLPYYCCSGLSMGFAVETIPKDEVTQEARSVPVDPNQLIPAPPSLWSHPRLSPHFSSRSPKQLKVRTLQRWGTQGQSSTSPSQHGQTYIGSNRPKLLINASSDKAEGFKQPGYMLKQL